MLVRFGIVFLVGYFGIVLVSAISTVRAANSLSNTDISQVIAEGSEGIESFEDSLSVFDRRYRLLKLWVFPVRQIAKVSVLAPPLDRQRQSGELLLSRLELDQQVAHSATTLARSLFSLRDDVLGAEQPSLNDDFTLLLGESLLDIESDAAEIVGLLENSANLGLKINSLKPIGPVQSVSRRMDGQEESLWRLSRFSELLAQIINADLAIRDSTGVAFATVNDFIEGGSSVDEVGAQLSDLTTEAANVNELTAELTRVAPAGIRQSEYFSLIEHLVTLNEAVFGVASAIQTIIEPMLSSIEILSSGEGAVFESGTGISEVLSSLVSSEAEIQLAVISIVDDLETLKIESETGPIPLGDTLSKLSERTGQLQDLASTITTAPRIAAEIFGVGGESKTYLVLGQTSDELRPHGGFTSSAWLLTFESGALVERGYVDINTFEDFDNLGKYPPAPRELQKQMDAGRHYLRDAGWDPHFPNAAEKAIELLSLDVDVQIDGVISITQWAFLDLASAVGGIFYAGKVRNDSELLEIIQSETDGQGTGFLGTLFDSLLQSLSGSNIKSNGVEFLSTIDQLFATKELMIYSIDPGTQRLVSQAAWDGALPLNTDDRLAIFDSNVGWNKVDGNIQRSYKYSVDLHDMGNPRSTLTLQYENSSDLLDNECEIQFNSYRSYDESSHGCYWNFVRVYGSLGSQLSSGDELPYAPGSIAVGVGLAEAEENSVVQEFDHNGSYISGLMILEPASVAEIEWENELQKQLLEIEDGTATYRLNVIGQPGARGRPGKLYVRLPEGSEITFLSHPETSMDGDTVEVALPESGNTTVVVTFTGFDQ